jgi:hypothetical protein
MSRETWKLTSTQIGAIAENIIANNLMIESGGRLSPFSPLADDGGIDLLIYDKKTGKALPVQVKARTGTINKPGKKEKSNVVHFEIRTVALKNEKYAFFLAVLLDQNLNNIERAWFIPIKDIRGVMNKRTKHSKYVMRANKNLSSRDKFSLYQCENMSKVYQRILKVFEA